MIQRMHAYRDELEKTIVGSAHVELERIFADAEISLARVSQLFEALVIGPSTGTLLSTVETITQANRVLEQLAVEVRRVIIEPGHAWADQAGELAHAAGQKLAHINFDVPEVSPTLLRTAVENVKLTKGILRIGYEDMYTIINTVGADVGEWFRRETMNAILEGLPVVSKTGGDSLMKRLVQSGRLQPIVIKTESGRLIRRSIAQRAEAIARIEMGRIVNRTHEILAQEVLGKTAVYRNSNPRDSRTTQICREASTQTPMTLAQWSASRFGRPPRLRPFHLCRSVLIGGLPDWFTAIT
jgi:hypothetical protein